ncbi:MAG TPA: hypothetical protein V6C81_06040 [Planktothrix sp.]
MKYQRTFPVLFDMGVRRGIVMASAIARIYLFGCMLGTLSILIIALYLESQGYTPHIHWICSYEMYKLVNILAVGSSMLCLATAGVTAVRVVKQFFVSPHLAAPPLAKMALVLTAAFIIPDLFKFMSQHAMGAGHYSAAVRSDVAATPHIVL